MRGPGGWLVRIGEVIVALGALYAIWFILEFGMVNFVTNFLKVVPAGSGRCGSCKPRDHRFDHAVDLFVGLYEVRRKVRFVKSPRNVTRQREVERNKRTSQISTGTFGKADRAATNRVADVENPGASQSG